MLRRLFSRFAQRQELYDQSEPAGDEMSDCTSTSVSLYALRMYVKTLPDEIVFDAAVKAEMEIHLGKQIFFSTFVRACLQEEYLARAVSRTEYLFWRPTITQTQKAKPSFMQRLTAIFNQ